MCLRLMRLPILEKQGCDDVFMRDIDVIARFGAYYFVIECKTNLPDSLLDEAAGSAESDAVVAGRLTVPLLCNFKKRSPPQIVGSGKGVYVFGVETLMNAEKLKALLQQALKSRQKSREP